MIIHCYLLCSLFIITVLLQWCTLASAAAVRINEVAPRGSSGGDCGRSDWVELYHDGTTADGPVAMSGYVLHDDRGALDDDAFVFPDGYAVAPGEYRVLCCGGEDDDPAGSPQFGIGGDDTITLLDANGSTVSTMGPLQDQEIPDVSYAHFDEDGSSSYTHAYTTIPTPGARNILSPLPTAEEIKAGLEARDALGTRFFGMDRDGHPVPDRLEDVLDLRLVMEEEDYLYTVRRHPWHEEYRPFASGRLLRRSDGTELASFAAPGRLRPKGQSTLFFALCLGIPSLPFSIDFDRTDANQTLFGARRVYLRNKLSDRSYLREWVFHRMLARFRLPHLRTRAVRFFLNDQYLGLYDLQEAPDSDHVFYRSFPDYDVDHHALYKIKTASTSCGKSKWYNPGNITAAYARINETEPYSFERGEHRPDVAVLNDPDACTEAFGDRLNQEKRDAVLAYVRHGQDCGEMLVEEGLVDRDYGVKEWDGAMKEFINEHLSNSTCAEQGCTDSNLASEVDVDNFLKVLAVFSVILHQDSPLGTGNNYYLAQTSNRGDGWKMVPYDLDNAATGVGVQICDEECTARMVHWSIARPTCHALEENQLAGPLLSDPTLYEQYLVHVRDFVETVLTNETFLEEIANHAAALQADVRNDAWNAYYAHDYSTELSSTAAPWYATGFPLLAVLRARADDVRAQLDALDSGNHSPEPVLAEQECVDWRGSDLIPDSCFNNCQYDGCYEPSWAVPGVCDRRTGICYHGPYDDNCAGVPNGGTYPNMMNRSDELVFCQEMIALSICQPAEMPTPTPSPERPTPTPSPERPTPSPAELPTPTPTPSPERPTQTTPTPTIDDVQLGSPSLSVRTVLPLHFVLVSVSLALVILL